MHYPTIPSNAIT